jgi:uncharacterized protein (TIGR03067 family)
MGTVMLKLAATFSLLSLGLLASEEETKKDLALLQGEWRVIAIESDGSKVPPMLLRSFLMTFKGNTFTAVHVEKVDDVDTELRSSGTFKIDPTKEPKWLDVVKKPASADEKETTQYAIYKFDGDKLIICSTRVGDKERPTTFAPKRKLGFTILTLERVKR